MPVADRGACDRRAPSPRRGTSTSYSAACATKIAPSSARSTVVGDRLERGGRAERGLVDAVDVRVAAGARRRAHERLDRRLARLAAPALDAHFDDAIARRVEPGHLEVDERERRLADRQVPRRPGRRRLADLHRSTHIAMPWPTPMQSAAMPRFAPRAFIARSERAEDAAAARADRVTERDRAAVHVDASRGRARARARTRSTAPRTPRSARRGRGRTRFQPARASAFLPAGIGPSPMKFGSTPAVAYETTRASGSSLALAHDVLADDEHRARRRR